MEKNITEFFNQRKARRLKEEIKKLIKEKGSCSEEDKILLQNKCNEKFDREQWIPDAIKRINRLAMVTHNPKITHPGIKKECGIIADKKYRCDGYLRTGNYPEMLDVIGDAAALDVYQFINLSLSDGKTVLEHIKNETDIIKQELAISNLSFSEIKRGFMSIKKQSTEIPTNDRLKQVYFPVGDDSYHLLSIMTPTGLMFSLKETISTLNYSEEAKEARTARKTGVFNERGYEEIFNLTEVGFGGANKQNIGILNNKYHGTTYMLQSVPPTLEKRKLHLPRYDFFRESLSHYQFNESFIALHKIFINESNNIHLKNKRDLIIKHIIDQVVLVIWRIRSSDQKWLSSENYSHLKADHRVLLDNNQKEIREQDDQWLESISEDFSRWMLKTYESILRKKAVKLGDTELRYFVAAIIHTKEALV